MPGIELFLIAMQLITSGQITAGTVEPAPTVIEVSAETDCADFADLDLGFEATEAEQEQADNACDMYPQNIRE